MSFLPGNVKSISFTESGLLLGFFVVTGRLVVVVVVVFGSCWSKQQTIGFDPNLQTCLVGLLHSERRRQNPCCLRYWQERSFSWNLKVLGNSSESSLSWAKTEKKKWIQLLNIYKNNTDNLKVIQKSVYICKYEIHFLFFTVFESCKLCRRSIVIL